MFRNTILSCLLLLSTRCMAQGSAGVGNCGCWTEPDSTWTYLGNPGAFHPEHPDLWTGFSSAGYYGPIDLPFPFGFFGQNFDSIFINTGGALSFGSQMGVASSSSFPFTGHGLIAPFLSDVDLYLPYFTPPEGVNVVAYKLTPSALFVSWSNVGYAPHHIDKLNSFQVVITDGSDPAVRDGNNVAFCYRAMQWASGSDPAGSGFGDLPATVGANRGDGVYYMQAGRFGYPDSTWNGRMIWSGVGWLNGRYMSFNTTNLDIPPFFSTMECDTVEVEAGALGHYELIAHRGGIAPPMTASVQCSTLSGFAYADENIDGAHVLVASYTPTEAEGGLHELHFQASTANGLNAETTRYVKVNATVGLREPSSVLGIAIAPNPASDRAILTWPDGQQPSRVEVFAMNGAVVLSKTPVVGASRMELHLSGLPDGIYTVRATGATSTSTVRLVRSSAR